MFLHELKPPKGSKKRRKIVGRGRRSGHGKTSGKGHKGQKARAGRAIIGSLEGGQVPLIRRIPKLGFRPHRPSIFQIVNVEHLNQFPNGTVVDAPFLKSKGLISNARNPFKVLGDGEIKKSLIIKANGISKSAEEKIVKAGGKIELIEKSSEEKSKQAPKK
jgi:large subunit ribosomal protein L15